MEHWFGTDLIVKWEKYAELRQIDSVNGKINLEVYRNNDPTRPTIIFSHGIAGYGRLMLPFLIPLYERGYNIIAPDLEGFGYNGRKKGDFTFDIHLANLRDTVNYARQTFKGKIFLGGGSMGGPLAYATDARYNCADGLVCWCLWDFADREFIRDTSTTKGLTFFLAPLMKIATRLLGKATFKTTRVVSYHTLTADPVFNSLILKDPQSGNTISVRGALSLILQAKPDLEHEKYEKPVIIFQPEDDEMTRAYFTKKVYNRLKSRNKKYISVKGAHFPTDRESFQKWGNHVDEFIQSLEAV
ncbi:MAG: alpha/beta hydrolase [Bacteroidota bacterium]